MARSKGTLALSSNIEPRMAAPLDARLVCEFKNELTSPVSLPYTYRGMRVSVTSEGRIYMLNADDPTDINNWIDVGSSADQEEMSFDDIKTIWDQVFNQ